MKPDSDVDRIDEILMARVAGMSRGSQRWLRTTLQSLVSADEPTDDADLEVTPRARLKTEVEPKKKPATPATLEDVVTGKADLRDHLEAYPELSAELDGMADIIDLLREAGARRRKRGEQILREEILGEAPREKDESG